jgi:hypothetical protein
VRADSADWVDRPEPADKRGQSAADLPFTPNGPSRLPGDHLPADVPEPAEYRAAVDAEYRKYAIDQGCARVREIEENVTTPAMRRIEAEDPSRHLVGLDHRLKGEERLAEKITEAMEERGWSAEEAFGMVKDAIRYTFQYSEKGYARGVHADSERLQASGFDPVDRKNTWESAEYKGINSRWQDPSSGQIFEVQFHTAASFEAKQETHAAYERLRSHPDDENEVRQLRAYQRDVTATIPVPPGASDIPSYRRET